MTVNSIVIAGVSLTVGLVAGILASAAQRTQPSERATGFGGVFFKSTDPKATAEWYGNNLGIKTRTWAKEGSAKIFEWRELDKPDQVTYTVWAPFKQDTKYFAPGAADFMINYRVRDLDAMLAQLKSAGVAVVGGPETHFNGRFAWILDLEGRKVELWQPAPGN